MIASIILWYPFFKVYEKRELEKEREVKSVISDEDAELIGDLNLDF